MSPPDSNETTALMDGDRAYQSISVQHMEDPQDELQQTSSLSSRRRSLLLVSIGMMVFVGCMLLSYDIGARSTSHGPAVEGTHLTPKAQLSFPPGGEDYSRNKVTCRPDNDNACERYHSKNKCQTAKDRCEWNDESDQKCCYEQMENR